MEMWGHWARLGFLATGIGASLGGAGCGGACNSMGCVSFLSVSIEPPLAEAGGYELAAVVDGEDIGCSFSLPGRPSECGMLWLHGTRLPVVEEGQVSTVLDDVAGFQI